MSIPPEREEFIDFSHSFYETHLAIAVRQQGFLALLAGFLSNRQALMILGGVPGLAALVCGLFFLLEKGSNAKLCSRPSRVGRMVEAFIMGLLFITRGPVNYQEPDSKVGGGTEVVLSRDRRRPIISVKWTKLLTSRHVGREFRHQRPFWLTSRTGSKICRARSVRLRARLQRGTRPRFLSVACDTRPLSLSG